jgi:hypothetical protein
MRDYETRAGGQTGAHPETLSRNGFADSTANGGELSDEHRHMLEVESGIAPAIIEARGYRTVTTKAALRALGFGEAQARVPALLVPVYDVYGQLATYQARPVMPRIVKGKSLKYETPKGSSMVLDVPVAVRQYIGNPQRPLWITEGAKKADAAVSRGLDCVALLGVWNWRGTNDESGKAMLPAFEVIAWNGRRVYLAFDSDVLDKDSVWLALTRLGAVLAQRGADVRVIRMPGGASGAKTGLDDYFVCGGTVDSLVSTAQPLADVAATKPGEGPYRFEHGGIWYSPNVDTDRQLCNFEARIVAEVRRDDGVESRLLFDIEAKHGNTVRTFTLPAAQFGGMNWVTEHLGASAAVNPGMAAKDHCRYAIQILSGDIPQRREFAHTGWADIGGERFYLTATGGIGAAGVRADLAVHLEGPLTGYALPEPPGGDALNRAVRASLAVLDVAPLAVTMPVYSAIWRAVLGDCDYSVFVAGQTGEGKSALSALAAQHYGPDIGKDGKRFAGNFEATANALEAQAFIAKDALFVVDDYNPGAAGSQHERARYERTAERLFRGSANKAGRGRMRADTSLSAAKYSRALLLASGEDIPRGHSLRSRMLITELGRGAMDWGMLSACQRDAEEGMYAQALAGYVQWLAAHPKQLNRLPGLRIKLRDTVGGIGAHRRTPSSVADMAASFRIFLDFATDTGTLTADDAGALFERGYAALLAVARQQDEHQAHSEPSIRYRELLAALVASGGAHLATLAGDVPKNGKAWGWRLNISADGDERWQPQGPRIGWFDDAAIYLEPSASYAAAQRLAQQGGESLAVSEVRLWKTLNERGHLLSTEPARRSLKVRRTIEGASRHVLQVGHGFFEIPESPLSPNADKADKTGDSTDSTSETGGEMSAFSEEMSADVGIENAKPTSKTPATTRDSGTNVGFVGNETGGGTLQKEKTRGATLPVSAFDAKADNMPTNGAQKPTKADIEPDPDGFRQCKGCGALLYDWVKADNCKKCQAEGWA